MAKRRRTPEEIYGSVANCAFQRWAQFALGRTNEDRIRADNEKETAYMALGLSNTDRP